MQGWPEADGGHAMTRGKRLHRLFLHVGHICVLVGVAALWVIILILVFPAMDNTSVVPAPNGIERTPGVNISASLLGMFSLLFSGLAALILEAVLLISYIRHMVHERAVNVLQHLAYCVGLVVTPMFWGLLAHFTYLVNRLVVVEEAQQGRATITMELLALLTLLSASALAILVEAGVVKSYRRAVHRHGREQLPSSGIPE